MGVDFLWDGTGLNYREGYSIAIIRLLGMVGGLLIAITIILQLIIKFLSKDKKPAVYEKVDVYVEIISMPNL